MFKNILIAVLSALLMVGCKPAPSGVVNQETKQEEHKNEVVKISKIAPLLAEFNASLKSIGALKSPTKSTQSQGAYRTMNISIDDHMALLGWSNKTDLGGGVIQFTRKTLNKDAANVVIEDVDSTIVLGPNDGQVERTDVVNASPAKPAGTYVTKGSFPRGGDKDVDVTTTFKIGNDSEKSYRYTLKWSGDSAIVKVVGDLPGGGSIDLQTNYSSWSGHLINKDGKRFNLSVLASNVSTEESAESSASIGVEFVGQAALNVDQNFKVIRQTNAVEGTVQGKVLDANGAEIGTIKEQADNPSSKDRSAVVTWNEADPETISLSYIAEIGTTIIAVMGSNGFVYL